MLGQPPNGTTGVPTWEQLLSPKNVSPTYRSGQRQPPRPSRRHQRSPGTGLAGGAPAGTLPRQSPHHLMRADSGVGA